MIGSVIKHLDYHCWWLIPYRCNYIWWWCLYHQWSIIVDDNLSISAQIWWCHQILSMISHRQTFAGGMKYISISNNSQYIAGNISQYIAGSDWPNAMLCWDRWMHGLVLTVERQKWCSWSMQYKTNMFKYFPTSQSTRQCVRLYERKKYLQIWAGMHKTKEFLYWTHSMCVWGGMYVCGVCLCVGYVCVRRHVCVWGYVLS